MDSRETLARVDWEIDATEAAEGGFARPVRLRCRNGHESDDATCLGAWFGPRGR